jgi:pimeloyl-ACP methyl ester carboxylesterase/DNA-binding winged helix-turn-helix (wHTH) protein
MAPEAGDRPDRSTVPGDPTYVFGDCEVDLARFELRSGGDVVHVEPQVFDVLAYLVRNRGRVVSKVELLEQVWGDRFVSESALASRMMAVRRAIGDDGGTQHVVRTVRGRGYQFVAPVDERGADEPLRPRRRADQLEQQLRMCTSDDGTRLAYATLGEGPPLVKAANWMTHLDYDWESPVWRHWLEGLAHGRQLVRYDERGCGLSDWQVDRFGMEAWVDDLETVVDAIGLERFPVVGVSQGAAVAIEYAVRHPGRVTRLVLSGAYCRGRLVRATTPEEHQEAALDVELARVGWGRDDDSFLQVFTHQFLPDGTPEQWQAFNELQRRTTSPENAVRFLEAFARIDVTDAARRVACPTLILHARWDRRVPYASARELAALIPDSRLVSLESRNHILTSFEPAWTVFLQEVDRFLG